MAITIKVQSSSGVNVNAGSNNYLNNVPALFDIQNGNFGYFYKSITNASAYGVAEEQEGSLFSGGAALLAKGQLAYDITTHVVTGRLDSLAFGEELNGLSGGYGQTSTPMSLGSADVSFGGLGLDAKDGDNVNGILYGVMTGDAAAFLKLLSTSAVKFTGGAGKDSFVAGNKADVLHGAGGADTLSGGKGADKLYGDAGADTLNGGQGVDVLYGGAGADKLSGDAGADKIYGDAGADRLTGGAGKDTFIFTKVSDSTAAHFDTITDFKHGDHIDLHSIDANTKKAKMQDFDFIGTHDFSHTAGELRYEKTSAGTDIFADVNGDGKADFAIHLATSLALREGDFIF